MALNWLPKERGHYCMCYTYVTVFVRNAANLAPVLRIRDGLSRISDPDLTIAPSRIWILDPEGKNHWIPDPTVHRNRDEK
jgi:hypothetical protein